MPCSQNMNRCRYFQMLFCKCSLNSCHRNALRYQTRNTWTSSGIRTAFIDFFKDNHDHTFVKSSSIIPENDPSLVTVNAGMNQFKPIFLDTLETGHRFSSLKRAVNSQKCIRCAGKHNDLDAVGRDLRHHTFFEMLGNWSFGDYGKREAIEMAWMLLTQVFKVDPKRLVITYFNGQVEHEDDQSIHQPASVNRNSNNNKNILERMEADVETIDNWCSIISRNGLTCHLDVDPSCVYSDGKNNDFGRNNTSEDDSILILGMGSRDNFWEMGLTGPCGPCTEIHYIVNPDKVSEIRSQCRDQVMTSHIKQQILENTLEIWNLVFMQFNRDRKGCLDPLKRRHVDTGMGLERITSILSTEKQASNYDTDLFTPLFDKIHSFTPHLPVYGGSLTDSRDISYRIIADHSRMFTVAAADGLVPGTRDAGHKLRRVIRAAHWEAVQSFALHQPFDLMTALIEQVSHSLGDAYPEIPDNLERIKGVVCEEVGIFHEKLRITRQKFKKMAKIKSSKNIKTMSGEEVFEFYKTLGSPLQLILQLGQKFDLEIDVDSFERIKEKEHEKSTEGSKIKTEQRQ